MKAALDLRQGKGTAEGLRKELVQCMAMCIRLAEEGDAALGIAAVQPSGPPPRYHLIYQNGDADAPASIRDSNGEVVLALCRRCGRGEAELAEPCVARDPLPEVTAGMEAIMCGDSSHTDALVHRLRSARATIADLVAHGDHHDREALASLDAFLATIP